MKIFAVCSFLLLILAAVQANSSPEARALSGKELKKTAG
ncbi:uncharacterized protein LOC113564858 [Drosophila erecta]|nr:uncharacterized protein LOC113564858 [Drosophila erecta]